MRYLTGISGFLLALGTFLPVFAVVIPARTLFAQENVSTLKNQIEENQVRIRSIEQEIQQVSSNLSEITQEGQSLAQTLQEIRQSENRLMREISLQEAKIRDAELRIIGFESGILDAQTQEETLRDFLESSIKQLHTYETVSLFEIFLTTQSFSEYLDQSYRIKQTYRAIHETIAELKDTTTLLIDQREATAQEQARLESLQQGLRDRESILTAQRNEVTSLLAATQNEESRYRALLQERENQRAALDAEVRAYESQLQFILDPTSIPPDGSRVLRWPLENVFITQRFGATVAARRLYVSGSHSGVDFRAAVGTPIYAVADGIVEGFGDTDGTCPRASWGKWIFIRHPNGLASAYGHLSLIRVSEGQRVRTGDLIGYSGNTGRTTAPHLHLTIFASRGVDGGEGARIDERPSVACPGKNYRMPLAPTNAYLDPLLYFPAASRSMFKDSAF